MKIDWKRKLTSRKLWLAIAGFVAGLIIIFGGSQETADKISGSIMSAAAIVAYAVGEGLADSSPNTTNTTNTSGEEDKKGE